MSKRRFALDVENEAMRDIQANPRYSMPLRSRDGGRMFVVSMEIPYRAQKRADSLISSRLACGKYREIYVLSIYPTHPRLSFADLPRFLSSLNRSSVFH